jgi:hypothetical protein
MVRVQEATDGTYTLLLNGKAAMTGLTQTQADKLAQAFAARAQSPKPSPITRKATGPESRAWTWRDLFRFRHSAY